jgi:hypothetical protein
MPCGNGLQFRGRCKLARIYTWDGLLARRRASRVHGAQRIRATVETGLRDFREHHFMR